MLILDFALTQAFLLPNSTQEKSLARRDFVQREHYPDVLGERQIGEGTTWPMLFSAR